MVYRITPGCVVPTRPTHVNRQDITVIILAANISYGMKSYGPRSLLHVNERETFLDYQINLIKTVYPTSDIMLVVGFLADRIIRKRPEGIRIIENQIFEDTNEAAQLRLAFNATLTHNVLILKDNVIFNMETLRAISQNESCVIVDTKNQIDEEDIGVNMRDQYVTHFTYNMPQRWCHIAYLTDKDLKIVRTICQNRDHSRLYLFEILNMLLEKTEKIRAIEPQNMEIIKIDISKHLGKLQR